MKNNQLKKNRVLFWTFAILSLLTIGFIIYNSAQIPLDSNARSHGIADLLRKLPFLNNWLDDKAFHRLVRKAAHFTEYGLLGVFVCGAAIAKHRINGRKYASICLLIPLLTAVADEYIQSFVGRTSAVYDIVIDFSGAVCGLLLMWILSIAFKRRK